MTDPLVTPVILCGADGYLWNSGNFMFRAEVMLRELARLEPDIRNAAKGAV
jgi:mannose-1-phosphate guanylyltransferase/mannose-6-phosphate isomerase